MVSEEDDKIIHEIIEQSDFDHIVVDSFVNGDSAADTAAYHFFARSQMPAGTAAKSGLSSSFTEIAEFTPGKCTACFKCISLCPDSAIKAKIIPESEIGFFVEEFANEITGENNLKQQFVKINIPSSAEGNEDGKLIIAIDPDKCKGCSVCSDICNDEAFSLKKRADKITEEKISLFKFFETLPETEKYYIGDKDILRISLLNESFLFTGGTNSCPGCSEQIAVKNLLNISGYMYGKESIGIVNALSCSRYYTSDYPFNPFMVPCINTGTEHALPLALGLRVRWDRAGWGDKKLWVLANEEIWNMIGNPEEMMYSGISGIKILIINRKIYTGNERGKIINNLESSKKIFYRNISLNDPGIMLKGIRSANEFSGPVIIETGCSCTDSVRTA